MEYLSLSIKKGHNPQSINSTDVTLVSYFYPSMEFPCVTGSIWVEEWYQKSPVVILFHPHNWIAYNAF